MLRGLGGGALELAPAPLQATAGHVAGTVCHRAGATGGVGAPGGVFAAETAAAAGVVAEHHVACAAATNVVDGGGAAEVSFELLVEAEHRAFAAAVDVAGTAAAGGEGSRGARVKTSQRRRAGGSLRRGGLGVLETDDIALTTAASEDGGATSMGHRRVRLNDAVI